MVTFAIIYISLMDDRPVKRVITVMSGGEIPLNAFQTVIDHGNKVVPIMWRLT